MGANDNNGSSSCRRGSPGHEQHQWNEFLDNVRDGIDICGDNGCPACIPNFEQRQHHTSPKHLGEAEEEEGGGGP